MVRGDGQSRVSKHSTAGRRRRPGTDPVFARVKIPSIGAPPRTKVERMKQRRFDALRRRCLVRFVIALKKIINIFKLNPRTTARSSKSNPHDFRPKNALFLAAYSSCAI